MFRNSNFLKLTSIKRLIAKLTNNCTHQKPTRLMLIFFCCQPPHSQHIRNIKCHKTFNIPAQRCFHGEESVFAFRQSGNILTFSLSRSRPDLCLWSLRKSHKNVHGCSKKLLWWECMCRLSVVEFFNNGKWVRQKCADHSGRINV